MDEFELQLERAFELQALREQMVEQRAETERQLAEHDAFMEHARACGYEERPPPRAEPAPVRQSAEVNMQYRVHNNALVPAAAQPQGPPELDPFTEAVVAAAIAEVRGELAAEIDQLRVEVRTYRAIANGQVVDLPRLAGGKDAA
jgi:hypothetical protein